MRGENLQKFLAASIMAVYILTVACQTLFRTADCYLKIYVTKVASWHENENLYL